MKNDLISRETAIHQTMGKLDYVDTIFDKPTESEIVYMLRSLPTVPAVPLEPLAEWLAEYAAPPVTECCVTADERTAAWKAVLNKFMEEQDAAD